MEFMLKAVYFVMDQDPEGPDLREPGGPGSAVLAELEGAARMLREAGFASGILRADRETGDLLPRPEEKKEEILFLGGSTELVRMLLDRGCYVAGYSHAGNPGDRFPGAGYILQEPHLIDPDSYVKIYQRQAGLPWTILQTRHCLVREFTPDDLDGIYALYDSRARRFLEPPSEDRDHERAVLRAYIDRIYSLYGFGHWAVTDRETGTLIGRIGFSALTSAMEKEAADLGIPAADADFGFLVAAERRGTGLAEEACAAILDYGFTELGFTRVRADARRDNTASVRLLRRLGFEPAGEQGDKIIFHIHIPEKGGI